MMKFFAFVAFLVPFFTSGRTIEVKPNTAVSTLREAVSKAKSGDTILVYKGTYPSLNTIINKSLTVIGKGFPVLDAQFKEEAVTILADNVTFEGFTVKNSKVGAMRDFAGIRLAKVNNAVIRNNQLQNNFFGIYLSEVTNSKITDNRIIGNHNNLASGNGIHAWQSSGNLIEGNYISGHRDGIYFEFVTDTRIVKNVSEKNARYGLHFMFSDDDSYRNNTFRSNGSGVAVMYSKRIDMLNNLFIENWGSSIYGLLLKDIRVSRIINNKFIRNTTGIYFEGTSRIQVTGNQISGNGWAIRLLANCEQNTFKENAFNGNSFDVSTNGSLNLNTFQRNYWDKYEGYDLNKDGIGDIPYRPVSLFAQIIEQIPQSVMLMRSFIVNLFDRVEKSIPSITPESVKDEEPKMIP